MLLNIFLVIAKRGKGVSNILKLYLLLDTKIKICDEIYRYKHAKRKSKEMSYNQYIYNGKSVSLHIYRRKSLSTPQF